MAVPWHADTIVVGGGTAGAAVAGLLAAASDQSVLLLEAGPDFGPRAAGRWPADLLDASALGYTLDWRYDSGLTYPGRVVKFERARVIGGCSAHNGCAAIWGSRVDYDGWAALGLDGWATDDLLPTFRAASDRLRVRHCRNDEVTPFHQRCLDAAAAIGLPLIDDLNDVDQDVGMAASPVNIVDGVRWNTAFAYLDPVRDRPHLAIVGDAPVDRLTVEGDRVTGVIARIDGAWRRIEAGRVVVCAGTYGSPAILLRSGVGEPAALRAIGIAPVHDLPGVGRNLHDHPAAALQFAGTPPLESEMRAFGARQWMPEEQTIAKIRSPRHPAGQPGFDLHLYPVGGPNPERDGGWRWTFPVACMTPRSRGSVTLVSADPLAAPAIDHRYLSDPEGHDRSVLLDGIKIARDITAQWSLRDALGAETQPGPETQSDGDLLRWIDATCEHYYHPVGTCAMGPAGDANAVVDARGKLNGLDGGYVADCSIMPFVPRANTNIPGLVVGERIAGWLLDQA
ncbi:MAG TPA: GMC family oxidoreductase N-terminal domain-containing protein [Thermomicrobiales bacterium]|nr:GMC family oxidoreductase N-terminal domain-containing protein [Thermomicrobiales bacterium]